MPARSERIFIFPDGDGRPARILRFPLWWDRNGFMERYRDRRVDLENPIDANCAWMLTSAEAAGWNAQCKERFSCDPLSGNPNVEEEMRRLESALRNAFWVIVESYEWESGLD